MTESVSVVIIGAGFGGIGMAIRLKMAGFTDVIVLEKAGDLGGTWRDNTYPGAACDTPSRLYCFSFERGPGWSRRFATQPEILGYLRHCAGKYGIEPRYGTEVEEAVYDDGHWRIRTTRGEHYTARALIMACGQLNRPKYPAFPNTFAGPHFHSARWDHDCEIAGRRVAVVGTGASAIQFVPHLAEQAGRLYVFQRTPAYVLVKADREYAAWERRLLGRLPFLNTLSRAKEYATYEARGLAFITFPRLLARYSERVRRALAEQIADRRLAQALTPDYVMGCKRVLISNDYYRALVRDNVEVITEPIERLTEHGVRTDDGREHEVDVVVYGTGFHAHGLPITVRGAGGRDLADAWHGGAEAYLGITVSGFPNLFLLYGPNTNLGHNSIIYMLESQFAYIEGCLRALAGVRSLDVRADVQERFNRAVQRDFRDTVWSTGCTSWYRDAEGRNISNWPGYTFAYRRATRRPDLADFHVT
jgi:cation diffusion facilitator CzcD-associated flavoprotein CzcO